MSLHGRGGHQPKSKSLLPSAFAARFDYPAKQRGISLFLVRGIQFPQKNQIPSGNPAAVLALRLWKQPDGPCCPTIQMHVGAASGSAPTPGPVSVENCAADHSAQRLGALVAEIVRENRPSDSGAVGKSFGNH